MTKKLFKLLFLIVFVLCIFLNSNKKNELHAIGGVDNRAIKVAHAFGFLNKNYLHTKNGPTHTYGKYNYTLLHNLMATGQKVELDTHYDTKRNRIMICHDLGSTCHTELKSFLRKYAGNYRSLIIETKSYPQHGRLKIKSLECFKSATLKYKRKIEVESFYENELVYLKNVNYKNRSLLFMNHKINFSKINTDRWKREKIDTLLMTPKTASDDYGNLKRNWKDNRIGFWTIDWPNDERGFNYIFRDNFKHHYFSSIYYMTNYGITPEGKRAIMALETVNNSNRDNYMINLLSYKQGLIIKNPKVFDCWFRDYKLGEKIGKSDYYSNKVLNELRNKFSITEEFFIKVMNDNGYRHVNNYFKADFFLEKMKRKINYYRQCQLKIIINNKSGSRNLKTNVYNKLISNVNIWKNTNTYKKLLTNLINHELSCI